MIDEHHGGPDEDECAWLVDGTEIHDTASMAKTGKSKARGGGRDCTGRPIHTQGWEPTSEGAEGIVKEVLAYA